MSYRRRRTQEQFVFRLIHSIVALFLYAIKGKPKVGLSVAVFLPLARNLRTVLAFGLYLADGLLSEIDEELPFSGHVVRFV